jgi:hypothetical protein
MPAPAQVAAQESEAEFELDVAGESLCRFVAGVALLPAFAVRVST